MSGYWSNWARTAAAEPLLRVAPRTLEQVQQVVRRAAQTGRRVKPVGAGHSFTAIAGTNGVQLDMSRLRGLVSADVARGQVTLWAGTHLWELPAILGPLGLALANMGDVDRQTISGATQTGTHGTGLALGGISTGIVGATIVVGSGEVLTISESENSELLPAVALGLGALGVLVTLTVQCVPRYLLHAVEAPAQLSEVLDNFTEISASADHFEFFWFPHTSAVRTKTNTRLALDDYPHAQNRPALPLSKFARFVDEEVMNNALLGALVYLQSFVPHLTPPLNRAIASVSSARSYCDESHRVYITQRRVRFREMEYALPIEAVPEAVRQLQQLIARRGFKISFPLEVRTAAADDLWLSTAYGRKSGYIAVHRYWRDNDTEYFAEAEKVLLAHGGRPHWGKMHTLDAAVLRERYPRFDDFVALRERFDPQRVFQNDYLRRVLGD